MSRRNRTPGPAAGAGARIAKILLGVLLLPFCAGYAWQFFLTLTQAVYAPRVPYYFTAGFLVYLTAHFLFSKPILTYVVGHELTHAFFAVLFGGSIKAFHASEAGGHVKLTKSNMIITLAPYFFPLYTFIALLLYWAARGAGFGGLEPWLIFLAGGTLAFHITLTLLFLRADQNDIREHGAFVSYPLIFIFNLMLIALLVRLLLAKDLDYLEFSAGGIIKGLKTVEKLYSGISALFLRKG